jgi:predicted RNA-binding Zn-ribbon protein involved in translation (DUF1610 family)
MLRLVPKTPAYSATARSNCPDCNGELAVLRVIAGRAASEYWTMRCTECGGIHLDIVKAAPRPFARQHDSDANGSASVGA